MNLKQELKEMAFDLGVDLFGATSANTLANAPEGHRSEDIMPGAQTIVVIAMKFLDTQVDILPVVGEQSTAYFGQSSRQKMYAAHGGLVARHLDDIGFKMARVIERKGYLAYHQMATEGGNDERYLMGMTSLKHAAIGAGLGVFGRNALLLTPQFGPRVRLAGIITNAELEPDSPLSANYCETCSEPCITQCPANALTTPQSPEVSYQINKFACCQYLGTRPACAVCMKVCPQGNSR